MLTYYNPIIRLSGRVSDSLFEFFIDVYLHFAFIDVYLHFAFIDVYLHFAFIDVYLHFAFVMYTSTLHCEIAGEFSRVALLHEGTEKEEQQAAALATESRKAQAQAALQAAETEAQRQEAQERLVQLEAPTATPREKLLGPASSVFSFTRSFTTLSDRLDAALSGQAPARLSAVDLVTVDGGPHTFWW